MEKLDCFNEVVFQVSRPISMTCNNISLTKEYEEAFTGYIAYYVALRFDAVLEECLKSWTKERIVRARGHSMSSLLKLSFWRRD